MWQRNLTPEAAVDARLGGVLGSIEDDRRLRLLVYGINFWPELTGVGKYSGELCDWLASRGHHVDVVTAPPYYPEWKVAVGYRQYAWWQQAKESGGTVRIHRCPLWVPKRVNAARRLVHLASFAAFSLPSLWRQFSRRPDAVVVIAPTLFVAPAALLLARWYKVPTWLHVQDFELDAMFGLMLEAGAAGGLKRMGLRLESALLGAFDRVSSITPKMVERLLSKGVATNRCRLLPNWVDLAGVYPLTGANRYRIELGVSDTDVLVVYAGNMGEKQGLEVVLDAARLLQSHSTIRFLLAGDGAARRRLQDAARGLERIAWLPLQPADRLNELLNAADVHVLPQRVDAADLVMPSKLIGMLASGRAVVGTASRDTQLGVVLDAVGYRVEPGDAVAMANALKELAADSGLRQRFGRAGREFAENNMALEPIMQAFSADMLELVDSAERGRSR